MIRRALIVGLTLILISSCTAETPQPTPKPVMTPTRAPTLTPTPHPSPTPVVGSLRVRDLPVNCRFGPGIVYEIIDELKPDQSAFVVGKDSTGNWWQIRDPGNPGGLCWVDKNTVTAGEDSRSVPVANAPFVTVTQLEVQTEPPRLIINCDAYPQIFVFRANITVNGPIVVTWKWEVSTGETGPDESLIFETAGTQSVQEFYRIQTPNDYWVNIHIFTPNERSARANFFAQCTP